MSSLHRLFSDVDAEDMRRHVRRRLQRTFSHLGDGEIDIRVANTNRSEDILIENFPELNASNSISIGEGSLPELNASISTSIGEIANIEECNLPIAFFPPKELPIDTYANLPIATKIKIVILHRINNF